MTADQAYAITLESGGAPAVLFEAFGPWPKCLRCSPSGLIEGIPMTVGTFTFLVRAITAAGDTIFAVPLTVTAAPPQE